MANVKFKYGDKIIETPNLEKKLKRMKITIDDIQIIDDIEKPKKITKELRYLENCFEAHYENGLEGYYDTIEEIPNKIGRYNLVKIIPYDEWMINYLE